jgi:nucleotide-binding universal stress UspA family protein
MQKILVPVDGSPSALHAVEYVAALYRRGSPIEIHLLNIQIPIVSGDIRRFVSQSMIDNYHRAESEDALKPAKAVLDRQEIPYTAGMQVGHIAETIAEYARRHGCDAIAMGTRGMGPVRNLVLGSVATQVMHLVDVPVTLVK